MSPHQETPSSASSTGFGPNEWLVDEIYQQYLQDPASVDRAWWDFFADYKPGTEVTPVTQAATPVGAQPTPVAAPVAAAPAAPAAPAPVAPATAQPVAAAPAPLRRRLHQHLAR
ncbi:2-oxoglutarate dehydrogenase E1 subunit family protein, partial [Kitasatospora saccharophila]|uniref:2-oxoglutarate dehydrogenase E1 subunit family protein n=1 Tax=Kitasatospora saccharophila TaxID=407973 RepID=UPI0031E26CAF